MARHFSDRYAYGMLRKLVAIQKKYCPNANPELPRRFVMKFRAFTLIDKLKRKKRAML